jgi:hypothetical protein
MSTGRPCFALLLVAPITACGPAGEPARAETGAVSQPAALAASEPASSSVEAGAPAERPAPSAAARQEPAPAPPQQAPRAKPSQAAADALGVAGLVQRKDLWPARVAFRKLARLDVTTYWNPGDELPLVSWDGANVGLDEGTFLFEWPAADTDVVERARDLAASLTPEAFALTLDGLRARPELWPLRLELTATQQFSDGTLVPPGREVALRFFEGDFAAVYDREVANYYTVEPFQTDLFAQARARLALPEAERRPFFLRSLEAALDPAAGLAALGDPDYVLVYAGRLGCPRCKAFTPELDAFYRRARESAPAGARFELVFLSCDPTAESARQYWSQARLPGGAIAFERRLEAANLLALPLRTLPGLFVFDRNGEVVDRNHPDAGSPSAEEVLAKFDARVAQAR